MLSVITTLAVRREVSLTGKQRHEIRHRKGVEKENGVTGEGHTTLGYQVPQAPKKVVKGNHQKVIFIEPNYSICNVKGKSKGTLMRYPPLLVSISSVTFHVFFNLRLFLQISTNFYFFIHISFSTFFSFNLEPFGFLTF